MKYQKWIDSHCHSLANKKILFVGGTGTIGLCTIKYLLSLKAEIVLAARNMDKAEKIKQSLLAQFPDALINLRELDISLIADIDAFVENLKDETFDCVINNAGVYHLDSYDTAGGNEIHFATNALGNGYFSEKILSHLNPSGKLILTNSMSSYFAHLSLDDIQNRKVRSKLKLYSLTKRTMLYNSLYLKSKLTEGKKIEICHPGIVATELFQKGYSALFMKTVFPLLKLLTHSPEKASLVIIQSLFVDTGQSEWICPRGLMGIWGYPKIKRIHKELLDIQNQKSVHEAMNALIKS